LKEKYAKEKTINNVEDPNTENKKDNYYYKTWNTNIEKKN